MEKRRLKSGRVQWVMARSTGALGRLATRGHAALYKRTGGKVGARWFGAPVIALEVVGRKSGRLRSVPVLGLRTDEDTFVVIPANAGSDKTPAWWLNLRAAGEAVAVVRGERRTVRPRVAEGEERERLWQAYARMYPQVDDYTRFTRRELPVVVLETV
jgi:deazaflavin-dependent oxidoreductase (nitroreductase family)